MKSLGPILEKKFQQARGKDFGLGMNPEFLSEGEAGRDFCNPDRIVIGGIDERTIRVQQQLYHDFPRLPARVHEQQNC
jgi:UDPglucose 6-dehydrogenase/GDP-mannose 6-dehydrogenase